MSSLDDKDFEEMASSADLTDAQGLDGQQVEQVADNADTSTATGETEDDGLLSVVRDVVDSSRQTEETASPAETEASDQNAAETDDDNYDNVPFSKHPDFKRLVRKKNEYRDQAQAYQQDAVRYQNVQNFMDQNGLDADEAADLLIIGGLMKTNPVEAWNRAKPVIQKLLIAAGEVLPEDLKGRVHSGEMSQEAALEVSRTRAMQQSMHATRSFEDQRRQQHEQQTAANALTQTAESWETERRAKDPNFDAKMPLIMREVAFLQRSEGIPNTPQGVQAMLQKAYKAVVLPAPATPRQVTKKVPITPVRGGQVAGGAKPAVNSTMDVLNNVLAASRGA